MKKTILIIPLVLSAAFLLSGLLPADEDRHERGQEHEREHEEEREHKSGYKPNRELEGQENQQQDSRWTESFFRPEGQLPAGKEYLSDADQPLYQKHCGECHMAYPPVMLPPVSWQAIMATLDDHYGDNAEIELQDAARIELYLTRYAAGQGKGDYSERMWYATKGMAAPQRITETDYFVGKHHEIPVKMVKDNPEVKSYSQCQACHPQADKGSFAENEIRIPGHGRWED